MYLWHYSQLDTLGGIKNANRPVGLEALAPCTAFGAPKTNQFQIVSKTEQFRTGPQLGLNRCKAYLKLLAVKLLVALEELNMLQGIFAPATYLMSRLKFALKLGLIGSLFLIPLGTIVYFLNGKISADIAIAETERQGVQEIVLGRRLLETT